MLCYNEDLKKKTWQFEKRIKQLQFEKRTKFSCVYSNVFLCHMFFYCLPPAKKYDQRQYTQREQKMIRDNTQKKNDQRQQPICLLAGTNQDNNTFACLHIPRQQQIQVL